METLTGEEARLLGCLIEKERTTPEYYPLTVNSLLAAANQKTNRAPVVDYDSLTIERTLRSLDEKGLIGLTRQSGGRATKYVHRSGDIYEVDPEQLAILAVLLLRGSQTPGELRSRSERYFDAVKPLDVIDTILNDLMTRSQPLVERLDRRPGQKEHRFRCLLTDSQQSVSVLPDPRPGEASAEPAPSTGSLAERVAILERQLRNLADELSVDFSDLATSPPNPGND